MKAWMVSAHPWGVLRDRTPELQAGSFFRTALDMGPGTRHVQRDCFGLLDSGRLFIFFLILDIKKEEEKCLGFLFITPRLRQLSCPVS